MPIGVPMREDDGLLTMGLRTDEVVERKQVWLLGCRRLGVCYERRAELLHQACALICGRFLAHTSP